MNELITARELSQPTENSGSRNRNLFDDAFSSIIFTSPNNDVLRRSTNDSASCFLPDATSLLSVLHEIQHGRDGVEPLESAPSPRTVVTDQELVDGAIRAVWEITESSSQEERQRLLVSLQKLKAAEKDASDKQDNDRLSKLQELGKLNGFDVRTGSDGGYQITIVDVDQGTQTYLIWVNRNGQVKKWCFGN